MNFNWLTLPPDPGWVKPLVRSGTDTSWLYPIMIILGFIVAIVLACIKMWKRYKISVEPFYWFILIGVPLAIFGANFGSCVLGEPAGKKWSEFFTKFGSGLAIEWGVMFVVAAACIYFPLVLKKPRYRIRDEFGEKPAVKRVSMWLYFDAVMPCILLAQFLGRWGNYFNQEVYGAALTESQAGLANFLNACLKGMYIPGQGWCQPLFLWEGLGNLVMFFVLYIGFEYIKQRKAGDLSACYLIWYGIFRACLEPLRNQQFKSTKSIVLSIIFAVIGILFIVYNHVFAARARRVKGTSLFFSPLSGSYVSSFFKSKKERYELKIDGLKQVLKVCDAGNSKVNPDKIKAKIELYQAKIKKIKENDIKTQTKIVEKCEYKINNLKQILHSSEAGGTKLNPAKIQNKIDKWEDRLNDANARLDNIKSGIASWDYPRDYVRTENELVYYSQW